MAEQNDRDNSASLFRVEEAQASKKKKRRVRIAKSDRVEKEPIEIVDKENCEIAKFSDSEDEDDPDNANTVIQVENRGHEANPDKKETLDEDDDDWRLESRASSPLASPLPSPRIDTKKGIDTEKVQAAHAAHKKLARNAVLYVAMGFFTLFAGITAL